MVLIMWWKHRCVVRCHNNNQKFKSIWIGYVAFQKIGNDKETDEWRNTFIVFVGRSHDTFIPSFNPDKHQTNYLISARFILNRVPYWLIHNSTTKIINTHSAKCNAMQIKCLKVAFDEVLQTENKPFSVDKRYTKPPWDHPRAQSVTLIHDHTPYCSRTVFICHVALSTEDYVSLVIRRSL